MIDSCAIPKRLERTILGAILVLFAGISFVGITWGLPSRKIDKYLFGDDPSWPGEKIYRLAGAAKKLTPDGAARRGADVDVDPLDKPDEEPILLTGTEEDVAKIYLRYRLYTYQPDEMITMMALAGMNPRRLQFDPRLYQYGGLFIYPVGALIGACGLVGLIDVRSDVVYYLDNPDEFGKFYVVARAYSAAWGLIGVVVVFAIARRLGGMGKGGLPVNRFDGTKHPGNPRGLKPAARNIETRAALKPAAQDNDGTVSPGDPCAGLLAALLFTLMPVVVCMAHEGKPHLPGAVLMLLAVLFAMRHLSSRAAGFSPRGAARADYAGLSGGMGEPSPPVRAAGETRTTSFAPGGFEHGTSSLHEHPRGLKPAAQIGHRDFWLMCICCGAALGMVLSSWPIFVLIPLVVWLDHKTRAASFGFRTMKRAVGGIVLAASVYLASNPYIVINAFVNREVLRSNFGNSLAMYEVARVGEGFIRVLELTVEGATVPILVLGVAALIVAILRKQSSIIPLAVPAFVFFLQFVLIGAGKPAEYGRFGIFTNTALAIGSACLLTRRWTRLHGMVSSIPGILALSWAGWHAALYTVNFVEDAGADGSRIRAARFEHARRHFGAERHWLLPNTIAVIAEPAPYCCPPLHFHRARVLLFQSFKSALTYCRSHPEVAAVIRHVDVRESLQAPKRLPPIPYYVVHPLTRQHLRDTPISWANKPFEICGPTIAEGYRLTIP